MNPDFILKHIPIGAFVKVIFVGGGSLYGTLTDTDREAIVLRAPDADGGGIQVIGYERIESTTSGETAMACNHISNQSGGAARFAEALAEVRRQAATIAEHAAE